MIRLMNRLDASPRPARHRASFVQTLMDLDAQYRARRRLNQLPPHLRQDIGLGLSDIHRECSRLSWDSPAWWS